jgi:hypothetical protein
MRSSLFMAAAVAGFGAGLFITFQADAVVSADPTGIRAGVETLNPVEPIHCRRYKHRHRYGHRWGYGCHGAGVYIEEDSGVDVRVRGRTRIHSHERATIRSDTTTRSTLKTKTGGSTSTGTTTTSDTSKTGTSVKTGGSKKIEAAPKQ